MPKVKQTSDIHSNVIDKQAELQKKSAVYNSEKIEAIINQDLADGGKPDTTPFFHGNYNWRDAGVIFDYTNEELEILDHCSIDCVWFVENYAKFLNKKGRTTVKLYDFQKENLEIFSSEIWNPEEEIVVPENQDIVLMQSRQTSKCLFGNTLVDTDKYGKIKLYKLYYIENINKSFLDKLIYYTNKLNDTKLFKNKLTNIIYKLESKKFGKEHQEKIIENNNIVQFKIKSKDKYNTITNLLRTKPFEIYHLELENKLNLDGADNHLVYSSNNYKEKWKFIKDLTENDYIYTELGWSKVKSVVNTHKLQFMFDISVKENDHSYYSNGILSHNTTSVSAYIAWYAIFHPDRNIFICANKGSTAKEIVGKVKEVLEGLPYFMKPGILNLSESNIKFENGSRIKCAAASKTPATGDSIHLLYIDEAALIPEGVINEYWASVIPTMSNLPNYQVIVSSTPRGKSGKFYELVDGAIKHENDCVFRRVDWWQVPGHDEKWAEKWRKKLGKELFAREFDLSFESDSTRLVSNKSILFMDRIKQEFVHRDFNNVPPEICEKIIWAPDFNPALMDYDTLYRKSFLFIVDTAQGIEAASIEKEDSDYNVINIFEIEAMSPNKININRNGGPITIKDCIQYKQVGLYIDNFKDEGASAEAAKFIAFQILKCGVGEIDNVRILIEMNFNGNNWLTKFKQHPSYYDALILKTVKGVQKPGQPLAKMKQQYGFRTTTGEYGKNYYCELGATMIHKRQILIRQYDQDVNLSSVNQLNQFGKNSKGKYEGSCCHDDIAITCLFVSIAQESKQFIVYLNMWLEKQYSTEKIYKIGQMLNIYIEREAQISDEEFSAFYSAASANFGKLTYKQKGYGALMSGNIDPYQFNNGGYHQGFGNILSGRRY